MQNIKRLLFIDDSLANKISYYHLLLLLCSLPFDMFYSHIILISFAAHTLLHINKNSFKALLKPYILILQSVFWVSVICLAYSSYKSEAYNEIGRRMLILSMPVLFSLTSFDLYKYRDRLLFGFALCCTVTITYLYFDAFRVIRFYHYPLSTIFKPAFTNHNFSDPIEMHATFFSLQVGLALVYFLSLFLKPARLGTRAFYAVCCFILSAGLIQLSSKSACAAVLATVGFAAPFLILKGKRRLYFIVGSVAMIAMLGILVHKSKTFRDRYITDLESDLSQAKKGEVIDPRLARWGLAVDVIKKAPIIGHGTGSEIPLLKDTYYDHKFYNSFLNGLNAHNEYLSFLIKSGFAGLLIYLFTLGYGFKTAIERKDIMLLTFLLLIAVVSLSENILDVDKGTIFYSLFFSFFVLSAKKEPAVVTKQLLKTQATITAAQPCYV